MSPRDGVQVRGLVFEANGSLAALAELVGAACQRLAAANVPHNLFIADCGARVFLLPNAFAERKVSTSCVTVQAHAVLNCMFLRQHLMRLHCIVSSRFVKLLHPLTVRTP